MVSDEKVGNAIFNKSCELFLKSFTEVGIPKEELIEEFILEYVPISSRGSSYYITPDKFRFILDMARKFRDETSLVNVLETRYHEGGSTYRHHFFISFLPCMYHKGSLSMPTFTVYAFIEAATSGYPGTGPMHYDMIQDNIKEFSDEIDHVVINIQDHRKFSDLFFKVGPIIEVRYPDHLYAFTDDKF